VYNNPSKVLNMMLITKMTQKFNL